jgi:hypothetical protein
MMDDTIECLKLLQQANKAQQESIVALHEGIVSISTMVQSLGERVAKLENCSPPVTVESLFSELDRLAPLIDSLPDKP